MNFKSYSFADLKALNNELRQRLDNPTFWAFKEQYLNTLNNSTKEIDKRLDAFIKPEKTNSVDYSHGIKMFIENFNQITGHKIRVADKKATRQAIERLKEGYSLVDFTKAIKSAYTDMTTRDTVKHLTPEFITRPSEFSKYLNMKDTGPKKVLSL